MITFSDYYKLTSLLEEGIEYVNLKSIPPNTVSRDMEELELVNYSSMGLSQGAGELEDDFNYPGFTGFGMFDTDKRKLLGYIYGYAISEDEESSIRYMDKDSIQFYDENFKGVVYNSDMSQLFTRDNTFYVANFNADKKISGYAYGMIPRLLKEIKTHGYTYLMFDGLNDTTNLFMKNGNIEGRKLARVGLDILATVKTGYSILALMKIK